MNNDVMLKYDALNDTIKKIENSIINIETTINNVQKEMLSFNENNWTGRQKEIIDDEFMPYLKTISTDYPSYLRERVKFLKKSIMLYQ